MSTDPSKRRCGSCGAPVDAADATCPRCGALLAAYEAPKGSEAMTTAMPALPPAPTAPVSTGHVVTDALRTRDERAQVTSAATPEPVPARAEAAAAEKPITLASSRKKAQPVPPRAEPARPPAERQATLPRRISIQQPHRERRRPLSTREVASTAASFGKLALGVLMILVVIGILDFDLVPILVLGVVLLSLLGVMRSAAKASGRKTTSMHDPRRHDGSRR